jgi:hypothetical protein
MSQPHRHGQWYPRVHCSGYHDAHTRAASARQSDANLKGHPQVTILHGVLVDVTQPRRRQEGSHLVNPSMTYRLSVKMATWGPAALQGGNSRLQLHTVVRCCRCPAAQFTHPAIGVENTHPPRRPQGSPGMLHRYRLLDRAYKRLLSVMPFTPSQESRRAYGAATHVPVSVHRLGRKVWSNNQ